MGDSIVSLERQQTVEESLSSTQDQASDEDTFVNLLLIPEATHIKEKHKKRQKIKDVGVEVLNLPEFVCGNQIDSRSCRMCLEHSKDVQMYSIFGTIDYIPITKLILKLFNIKIDEDSKLSLICEYCLVKIDLSIGIHRDFIDANQRLNNLYIGSEVKVEALLENAEELEIVQDERDNESSNDILGEEVKATKLRKQMRAQIKCYVCETAFETASTLQTHLPEHIDKLPFTCGMCDVGEIRDIRILNKHLALHDQNRRFKCHSCNYRFFWKKVREKHERTHESPTEKSKSLYEERRNRYKCYMCNVEYQTEDLFKNHLPKHFHELPYKCAKCDLVISTAKSVNRHLELHDENERPFKCRYCELRFTNTTNRRAHERRLHPLTPSIHKKSTRTRHMKFQLVQENKKYQCSHCGILCGNASKLEVHENTHTGKSKFKCKTCGKKISTKTNLERHERIHTGENPYKCEICGIAYNQSTQLKQHLTIHTGGTPYECTTCLKNFRTSTILLRHKRSVHSDATNTSNMRYSIQKGRLNQCSFCKLDFSRNFELIDHLEKDHPNEAIQYFNCNDCGKRFTNLSKLRLHIRHVHTIHEQFKCTICDKHCKSKVAFIDHQNVHTGLKPYECKICGNKYKKRCNMKRHERIHTGEKPWSCDLCDKAFNQLTSMQSHRRVHTGEKPFECSVCQKKFGDHGTLYKHRKTHASN